MRLARSARPALLAIPAIALLLLVQGLIAAVGPDETDVPVVDLDVFIPLENVKPAAEGYLATIAAGTADGLVIGGQRGVYRPDDTEGVQLLGAAELVDVGDSVTTVAVTLTEADSLAAGGMVQVRLRVPPPPRDLLTWRLARLGMTLTERDGSVVFDYRAILRQPDLDHDARVCRIGAERVRSLAAVVRDHPSLQDTIREFRYAGRHPVDVMASVTEADIENYLYYVLTFPALYTGRTFNIEETFAGWMVSGGEPSGLEILARAADLTGAERSAYLQANLAIMANPEYLVHGDWYAEIRRLWSKERHEEAMGLLEVYREGAELVGTDPWWSLYWSTRADVLYWNGQYDEAI